MNFLKSMVITLYSIAVLGALCSTSNVASDSFAATGVNIDISQLDTSSRFDLLRTYQRIQDAAMLSCDPSGESKVLPHFNRAEGGDCYSDTLVAALTRYDEPALLNIHEELRMEPIVGPIRD